jgi:hypothetical protein
MFRFFEPIQMLLAVVLQKLLVVLSETKAFRVAARSRSVPFAQRSEGKAYGRSLWGSEGRKIPFC